MLEINGKLRISTPDVNSIVCSNFWDTDGHIWGPNYGKWKEIINQSLFRDCKINFFHYVDDNKNHILKLINHELMPVYRTPENDHRTTNYNLVRSIVFEIEKIK